MNNLPSLTHILHQSDRVPDDCFHSHDYRGVSLLVDAQLYKDAYSVWLEKATAIHDTISSNQTFALQHVSSAFAEYGAVQGGNPMGILQQTHTCE